MKMVKTGAFANSLNRRNQKKALFNDRAFFDGLKRKKKDLLDV